MTEPTDAGPDHDALFKALKDLIVEAQAVADDHHRPRHMRLDQALVSARSAMLDYWAATPQPTQAQAGAVPPEAEPIVLNCEAPGDLKPGDYVFASRWSDCDPGDPWEVGFVSEVGVYPESMTKAGYVVLQGGSRRWGRAMRITPEQGLRICEQFPSMERLPQDYDAIARVFGIKGGQHVGNVD